MTLVDQTLTDVDGNYEFTLLAGEYTFCEEARMGYDQSFPNAGANDVCDAPFDRS